MKITWLGHSCFRLESGTYSIVIDPYKLDSYPQLQISANEVYCTHEHYDHNYREGVSILPKEESPFTVEEMDSFHDDQEGALRGTNKLYSFCAEGLRVIHCGDLGHLPNAAQKKYLTDADVLMIPVGGYYTIDAAAAKRIVDETHPRVVIPMHYRHGKIGLEVLTEVSDFADLFDKENVTRVKADNIDVSDCSPAGVIIFEFK